MQEVASAVSSMQVRQGVQQDVADHEPGMEKMHGSESECGSLSRHSGAGSSGGSRGSNTGSQSMGTMGMEMEMAGSGSSCNYDALLVAYRQHVGRGKQSKPSLWQGPGQEHQ